MFIGHFPTTNINYPMQIDRDFESNLKPMFFVHIPKTAGTSVRVGVESFLGHYRMALDYGRDNPATSRIIKRLVYDSNDPDAFRTAFDQHDLKFLAGHVQIDNYIGLFDLDNVATFVRDPVQRVVSDYLHFVRHYGYKHEIDTFISTAHFQNRQARALAGVAIEQIGFIGLFERFDESMRLLNEHFGWKIPKRKANLSERPIERPREIQSSIERKILECNQLDHILYKKACTLFHQSPALSQDSVASSIGACRLNADGLLKGWTCRIGSEKASEVLVEVNGKQVARMRADLYRPDIRRRGYKRSGCTGFEHQLKKLAKGDLVRCFECDGETELVNSPIRVK